MEPFLKNRKIIIELGSGNGCIKSILKNNIILTDIVQYEWIDEEVDMLKLNLNERYLNNVDAIIINHSLHHCANPYQTLKKMNKYLKKGGLILINEPETSIILRIIQIILKTLFLFKHICTFSPAISSYFNLLMISVTEVCP